MSKTAPFSMRLPPELKARLQKLAEAENRSLTNFIETKLREIAYDQQIARARERQKERT
jgi:predicted transcriptional regulator